MIGTFAVVGAWTLMGATDNPPFGTMILLLVGGLIAGVAASGATAVAVERIAYRRLRRMNAPPLIFLITAIGVSLVLSETFGLWQGRLVKGMPNVFPRKVVFTIGNTTIDNRQLLTVVAALVMMAALD